MMSMPPAININLLEHDTSRQQVMAEMLIITLLTAILALSMVVIYFNQAEQARLEQKENHRLTQELLRYRPSQAAMTLNQDMEKQLGTKSGLVNNLRLQGIPAAKILDDIEQAMPDGVMLININLTEGKTMLKGYAPDFVSVSRLMVSLKSSPHFHDVNVLSAQREEDSGEVSFSVEMVWRGGKT